MSVISALFSFVAIFVALEMFFVQGWLTFSNNAKAAYQRITRIRRPFGPYDKNTIAQNYSQIELSVQLYPKVLIIFSFLISVSTILICLVFYFTAWTYVNYNILGSLGFVALGFLALVVVILSVYSWHELRAIDWKRRIVHEFLRNDVYITVEEVANKLTRDPH